MGNALKPKRKNQKKAEKLARRARLRRRVAVTFSVLMGAVALMATSGAFIFAYDYFTQTQHFRAHRTMVTGHRRLSRQDVLKIAELGAQANILSVNLTATRKRLLANPWIAKATVSREIPSALHIDIVEELPLAFLDMGGGKGFLIDADGIVFKRKAHADGDTMIRVTGLSYADLPVTEKLRTKAFRSMMNLLRLVGKKDSPIEISRIRRIHMDHEIGATIYIGADNRAVKFGFSRYSEKCAALRQVMAWLGKDSRLARYQTIDLFDVDRIVITPSPAAPTGSDSEEV